LSFQSFLKLQIELRIVPINPSACGMITRNKGGWFSTITAAAARARLG
jgi:hypothetical protein